MDCIDAGSHLLAIDPENKGINATDVQGDLAGRALGRRAALSCGAPGRVRPMRGPRRRRARASRRRARGHAPSRAPRHGLARGHARGHPVLRRERRGPGSGRLRHEGRDRGRDRGPRGRREGRREAGGWRLSRPDAGRRGRQRRFERPSHGGSAPPRPRPSTRRRRAWPSRKASGTPNV